MSREMSRCDRMQGKERCATRAAALVYPLEENFRPRAANALHEGVWWMNPVWCFTCEAAGRREQHSIPGIRSSLPSTTAAHVANNNRYPLCSPQLAVGVVAATVALHRQSSIAHPTH